MNDLTPEPYAISPSARKLAERYGVSPEVMEEIINDTRSRAEVRRTGTPNKVFEPVVQPVVVVPPPTPVAPVAAPTPVPHSGSVTTVVPVETHSDGSSKAESTLSALTVVLVILLILALIGLIYLWQSQREMTEKKPVVADTTHVQQPIPESVDTTHELVSQIDTAIPPAAAPKHTPKNLHRTVARNRRAAGNHFYTTSSMLGAQERLAELRASGNKGAYLETVNRGNSTYYRLHTGAAKARHRRR